MKKQNNIPKIKKERNEKIAKEKDRKNKRKRSKGECIEENFH